MRSLKNLLWLGVVLSIAFGIALVGCGGDDDSTGIAPGSLTDPNFVAVNGEVEVFVDSTLDWILTGLGSMSTLGVGAGVDPINYGPTDPNAVFDTSSAIYTSDGWHIIHLSFSSDIYSGSVTDSIKFLLNSVAQEDASGLDQMEFNHWWDYNPLDTAITGKTYDANNHLSFTGLNTSTAVINGTSNMTISDKFVSVDSTVIRDFDFQATLTNVGINKSPIGWGQSCPNSGTATVSVDMTYTKDGGTPITTSWAFTLTFVNGVVNISATAGNTTWTNSYQACTASL